MTSPPRSLPHFNPDDPLPTLHRAGVEFTRVKTSNRVTGDYADLAGLAKSGEKFEFTLPHPARVQAAFGHEGVLKKLLKLLKDEVQVGDSRFDDEVYIATGHPESTERFLRDPDVRDLIIDFVRDGGSIVIQGKNVTVDAVQKGVEATIDEADVARFICHVLAFV